MTTVNTTSPCKGSSTKLSNPCKGIPTPKEVKNDEPKLTNPTKQRRSKVAKIIVKRLCAWCKKDLDTGKQFTDKEYEELSKNASHSMCKECLKIWKK